MSAHSSWLQAVFKPGDEGFSSVGKGVLGRGVLRQVEVPQEDLRAGWNISEVLGDLPESPAGPPVALVGLPFLRSRPALIKVPLVLGVRDRGRHCLWLEQSSGRVVGPPEAAEGAASHPSKVSLEADTTPEEWCSQVARTVEEIKIGPLAKAVNARKLSLIGDGPFSVTRFCSQLGTLFPSAMILAFEKMLMASPELLVRREGMQVSSVPLAGTLPRGKSVEDDLELGRRLLNSTDLGIEHQIVVDAVTEALGPVCEEMVVDEVPRLMTLPNVHHLATRVSGTLRREVGVLQLAAEMHPTPAVCGAPMDLAYKVLETAESWDRCFYGGAIGWTDSSGDGELAVSIRGARLEGSRADVFVGNGIVGSSQPDLELAETRAKVAMILQALLEP